MRFNTAQAELIKVTMFTSSVKLKGINSIIGYVLKESDSLDLEQINECGSITEYKELISIFVKSIKTARKNKLGKNT